MTTDNRRKAAIRAFAEANGLKYTSALRALEDGFRYPMDRATEGFYRAEYAIEGAERRDAFRRRIDFVTDPLVSPADLHEHLVKGASDIDVRDTAALRPDLLPETMYFLVKQGITGDGLANVVKNPSADRRTLSLIVGNSQALNEVLIDVVTHPNVDDLLLRRLSKIAGRQDVRRAAKDEIARLSGAL